MSNDKEPVYYKSEDIIPALNLLRDKSLKFPLLITFETPPFHRFPEDVKKDIEKAGYQISIHPQTLGHEYYDAIRITYNWRQHLPEEKPPIESGTDLTPVTTIGMCLLTIIFIIWMLIK